MDPRRRLARPPPCAPERSRAVRRAARGGPACPGDAPLAVPRRARGDVTSIWGSRGAQRRREHKNGSKARGLTERITRRVREALRVGALSQDGGLEGADAAQVALRKHQHPRSAAQLPAPCASRARAGGPTVLPAPLAC